MSIIRVALQEDLNENYDPQRLENEWSTEVPMYTDPGLTLDDLAEKTRTYVDFLRDKGVADREILRACTYSKASLEAMLQNASGLRIYLAADTKTDENGETFMDIYPIMVPVNDSFVDLLDNDSTSQKFIMDKASKCPPPAGACTEQFFKISPK